MLSLQPVRLQGLKSCQVRKSLYVGLSFTQRFVPLAPGFSWRIYQLLASTSGWNDEDSKQASAVNVLRTVPLLVGKE